MDADCNLQVWPVGSSTIHGPSLAAGRALHARGNTHRLHPRNPNTLHGSSRHKVLQYHRTEWGHWNCCEWRRTGITHRLHSWNKMPFPDVLMQKFNRHIFTLFKSALLTWFALAGVRIRWRSVLDGEPLVVVGFYLHWWTGGRPTMPRVFLHSQFLGPSCQEYFQPSHFLWLPCPNN